MDLKHAIQKYWRSDDWKEKRKQVLGRDNFACVVCGKKTNLSVHHTNESEIRSKSLTFQNAEVDPYSYMHFYVNTSLNELETLCFTCHQEADGHVKKVTQRQAQTSSKQSCSCESKYKCKCECQCKRCQEQRENPKPLPEMKPVSQEMKAWIRAEATKWKAEKEGETHGN